MASVSALGSSVTAAQEPLKLHVQVRVLAPQRNGECLKPVISMRRTS